MVHSFEDLCSGKAVINDSLTGKPIPKESWFHLAKLNDEANKMEAGDLTKEEVLCLCALADTGHQGEDVVGGLMKIGAFNVLPGGADQQMRLSFFIERKAKEFDKAHEESIVRLREQRRNKS